MGKQRNMFQMKEQDKTPEELSEVEIGNLPDKDFKVMMVKMIRELRRRLNEESKKLKDNLWNWRKYWQMMQPTRC